MVEAADELRSENPFLHPYLVSNFITLLMESDERSTPLRDCLVSLSGLRTGLFSPSMPAFSARSWATNLKSRPPLGRKSLVLAYGLTYQTVSNTSHFGTFCVFVLWRARLAFDEG